MRSKASGALVKYRKLVNVEDFSQWTWDEVIEAARKATTMRAEIEEIVTSTYGDYIARLTMASAVKRGGIKEFCDETGLNYGTVKNWRSRYLTAEQKREYKLAEPEPEPESRRDELIRLSEQGVYDPADGIVTVDDNSGEEAQPEFEDMFNGETPKASELEVDWEGDLRVIEPTQMSSSVLMTEREFFEKEVERAIANTGEGILAHVIVVYKTGEEWYREVSEL